MVAGQRAVLQFVDEAIEVSAHPRSLCRNKECRGPRFEVHSWVSDPAAPAVLPAPATSPAAQLASTSLRAQPHHSGKCLNRVGSQLGRFRKKARQEIVRLFRHGESGGNLMPQKGALLWAQYCCRWQHRHDRSCWSSPFAEAKNILHIIQSRRPPMGPLGSTQSPGGKRIAAGGFVR